MSRKQWIGWAAVLLFLTAVGCQVEPTEQGLSAEEAASQIDKRSHAAHYPNITGMGANPLAVKRIFELLEEGNGGEQE